MDKIQQQNNLPLLKVLVVDDAASIRLLVTEYFRRTANIIVGEAGDRGEAFSQMKEFSPDVVLMDISLAGTSGVDVTRQIKSDFPGVRIYLFSAYNADEYRDMKNDSLCDGFIQKTNLKTELQQMIQVELKRKKTLPVVENSKI